MNPDFQAALHWFYIAVMTLGTLTFLSLWRNPKGVPAYEYAIASFIPIWSGLAYMGLAFDQAKLEVAGRVVHWGRYADWVVTTPLLLVALACTAMYTAKKDYTLIGSLVGAQVVVIVCGLVADLSTDPTQRVAWYIAGTGAFFAVLYVIWSPLVAIADAQGRAVGDTYRRVATYFTGFWVLYPVVWLIGPSGLGWVSQDVDTLLFVALPIFSKVGFSLYDLSQLRALETRGGAHQTQSVAAR
jgi:bacteriorhodopsin